MRYADNTNYPEIYKHTYWGRFTTDNAIITPIEQARNLFIQQYRIVKYKECPNKYLEMRRKFSLRHTEYYEDEAGRFIYLYSMHKSIPLVDVFMPIDSMYAEDQTTAIQIFETIKSKKNEIQSRK